jgi:hypothetical protein
MALDGRLIILILQRNLAYGAGQPRILNKAAALNTRNEFRHCIVPRWRGLGVDLIIINMIMKIIYIDLEFAMEWDTDFRMSTP